jgi:hypothetical protein
MGDDCRAVLLLAEERVGDVATIELADGEQVDHRDEHARPGRERDGRQLEVHPVRNVSRRRSGR